MHALPTALHPDSPPHCLHTKYTLAHKSFELISCASLGLAVVGDPLHVGQLAQLLQEHDVLCSSLYRIF